MERRTAIVLSPRPPFSPDRVLRSPLILRRDIRTQNRNGESTEGGHEGERDEGNGGGSNNNSGGLTLTREEEEAEE